jgi:hypothetical protein
LKIFGVFKARTKQLSLDIPIFLGVSAGFSAQKYHYHSTIIFISEPHGFKIWPFNASSSASSLINFVDDFYLSLL